MGEQKNMDNWFTVSDATKHSYIRLTGLHLCLIGPNKAELNPRVSLWTQMSLC